MKDIIKTQQHVEEIKTINGRKVQVNRRKRRNNMNGYYAVAVVFAAIIAVVLCLTVFFNIDKIQVEGVSLYRYDQILSVGGASKGGNLVRTDTDAIEERLKNTLVYIDDVTVKKQYPSKLVITCTEAEKAADILCDDAYYVISNSGKILESKNPKPSEKIPVVKGFELKSKNPGGKLESEDSFKAEILNDLLNNLKEQEFEKITEIDISSRSDIVLIYDDRIEIQLGSSVDMDYKLSYFKAVIEKCLTKGYKGILVYNGADSGISAIPKEQDGGKNESSQSDGNSSGIDSSSEVSDSSAVSNANYTDAYAPSDTDDASDGQDNGGGYGVQAYTNRDYDYSDNYQNSGSDDALRSYGSNGYGT